MLPEALLSRGGNRMNNQRRRGAITRIAAFVAHIDLKLFVVVNNQLEETLGRVVNAIAIELVQTTVGTKLPGGRPRRPVLNNDLTFDFRLARVLQKTDF